MKKICNKCLYFIECWEEYSDYCLRDKEFINKEKDEKIIRNKNISYNESKF
jgi:hypothetical protein